MSQRRYAERSLVLTPLGLTPNDIRASDFGGPPASLLPPPGGALPARRPPAVPEPSKYHAIITRALNNS
eukprot:1187200-Prorocentrum_minimum.AAC.5